MEELVSEILRRVVEAGSLLEEVAGRPIPREVLERVLREVEHIAIHELAHGAIRAVFPEIGELEEADPTWECVGEVLCRVVEAYASSRLGVEVHSFEEHAMELSLYSRLSGMEIGAEDLGELYREVEPLLEGGGLREALELVAERCGRWSGRAVV